MLSNIFSALAWHEHTKLFERMPKKKFVEDQASEEEKWKLSGYKNEVCVLWIHIRIKLLIFIIHFLCNIMFLHCNEEEKSCLLSYIEFVKNA